VKRDGLPEDLRRPVPRVVVQEGADAGEDRAERPEPRPATTGYS